MFEYEEDRTSHVNRTTTTKMREHSADSRSGAGIKEIMKGGATRASLLRFNTFKKQGFNFSELRPSDPLK